MNINILIGTDPVRSKYNYVLISVYPTYQRRIEIVREPIYYVNRL